MKTTLKRTRAVVLHTIVFVLTIAFAASGQSTKISGTLRHGSGLLDIPVASVLPHMALTGTYSGFWTSNDVDFSTDGEGGITGTEPFEGGWERRSGACSGAVRPSRGGGHGPISGGNGGRWRPLGRLWTPFAPQSPGPRTGPGGGWSLPEQPRLRRRGRVRSDSPG